MLTAHRVEFVAIGGFAAYLQGSPIPTTDIDVVPRSERDNLARLSDALTELEAKLRTEGIEPLPFAHTAESLTDARIWNLTTKYGDLDITFMPSGTQGFDDLRRDAIQVDLRGTKILLASLADIVRSKGAAGRDKDRRALPVLRELLAKEKRPRKE